METTQIQEIGELIRAGDAASLASLTAHLSPADWADVVHGLDDEELETLIALLPEAEVPDILSELAPEDAATMLRALPRHEAADVLEAMDPDDATDVVETMSAGEAEQFLHAMEPDEALELRELLAYPPDSAGGLMTPAFVGIEPDLRADEAIDGLRRLSQEVETFNYVYVIDPEEHLLGVLSLRNLLLADPDTPVRSLMVQEVAKVRATEDQQVAAEMVRDLNLLALPVVDAEDHLLGIITADDAIDVLERELTEDLLRIAGTDAEEMERRSPVQIAQLRLPWLLGTMGLELVAGLVIHRFDHVLKEVILLASFMPIISAISGNVGLQAAAIVVRGLDTGHVSLNRWWKQLSKELETTLLMAVACGLVLGIIGAAWSRHLPFGIVIGVALTASMMTAAVMGTMIPMFSKRLGFDPATTAGPFETAFQDVIGFGVFLWLASLLAHWLV